MAGFFDALDPFQNAPETTGAIAPPSPAASGPSGRGIADYIGDAFSGQGLLGGSATDKDPVPGGMGITRGDERKANMQSLMGVGLMLMAAGSRQTDNNRAALLAKIPELANPADKLNTLTASRLKLAQIKLAERKQLAEEAQDKALDAALAGAMGGAKPAATSPTGASSAPMAAATPSPAAGGAATPVPGAVASADTPAPGAEPAQFVLPGGGGTVPAPSRGGPPQTMPPPPPPGMTPMELASIRAMPREQRGKALLDRQLANQQIEYQGTPYVDPATQQQMVPIYKNGVLVRTQAQGQLAEEVVDRDGFRETIRGGRVIKRDEIRDPAAEEDRKNVAKVLTGGYDEINKRYIETVRPAVDGIARSQKLKTLLADDKMFTGTAAEVRMNIANMMASAGMVDEDTKQRLANSADLTAELKSAAGEWAKDNYGPQVSNEDRVSAEKFFQAALSNDKTVLRASLDRLIRNSKERITRYNEDVDHHNERLDKSKSIGEETRNIIRGRRVDIPKEEPAREEKTIGGVTYYKQDGKWFSK